MILRRRLGISVVTLAVGALIALMAALSPTAALGAALVSVAIVAVMAWPGEKRWIITHPRGIRIAGFVLMVAGPLVIPLAAIASGLYASHEPFVLGAAVGLACIGVVAVTLPTSLAAAARDHARVREVSRQRVREPAVSAVRLAVDSIATLGANLVPLARIFAPWALVSWVIFGAASAYADRVASGETGNPVLALLVLGVGVWIAVLTWPVLIVAWSRFVMERRYPRHHLALPDRAYLSVLWRGAILVGVLGTAAEMAAVQAPALSGALGVSDVESVSELLSSVALLAGFVLLSSFALVVPARAVGDRTMSSAISAACLGRFHGGHFLGLIILLAPFLIVRGLLQGLTPDSPEPFALRAALSLAMLVVNLATLAAVTTYLVRLYGHCQAAARACDPVTALQSEASPA